MIIRVVAAVLVLAMSAIALAVPGSYERSIANVLISEGGYTNDRSDPGGPTNWGITIYDVRKYVKADASAADVKRLTKATAIRIYKSRYWDAVRADELPAGLDYSVFDEGVNSGVVRAGKVLRRLVGAPPDDGVITDAVLTQIKRRDPVLLISAFNDERLGFLKRLHTWPVFGKGWGRRVASVKAISLDMAGARPPGLLQRELVPALGRGKGYATPDIEDGDIQMLPP